jgi:hypothetical protein
MPLRGGRSRRSISQTGSLIRQFRSAIYPGAVVKEIIE